MKYAVMTPSGKRGKYDPTKADRNSPFVRWRRILEDMFSLHDPDSDDELDVFLEVYEGREAELHWEMKAQYRGSCDAKIFKYNLLETSATPLDIRGRTGQFA